MLFQEAMGVGEGLGEAEVVVMKGVGVGAAMSVVQIRSASRVVSRPVAESVRLEVGIVKGFGLGKIVGVGVAVGVGVGEGGGVGEGVGAAPILPNATGPVTVIRIGGRGYWGTPVGSVGSQVFR